MKKYDLIIIGSGPAGLSAAVYGKRAGLDLIVLEKSPMSGGQVLNTYEVDNYLGMPGINGFDMGMQFREHADKLGVEFVNAEVLSVEPEAEAGAEMLAAEHGIDAVAGCGETPAAECGDTFSCGLKIVHTDAGDFAAEALIAATGADHAHLGVPGEVEFSGRGVSYCATCDGAFFRNKTTAVIGGGDVALEDAISLARFCKKVYCIHRRDEFRGAYVLQQELKALPNVEILYSHKAVEIVGENVVTKLILEDVKTKEQKDLPVDGVFVAVGIHPNTELVRELVACDEGGYIIAGEDCVTDQAGVYAAGDVRRKPLRQIVTAVADGANAVTSAGAYLSAKRSGGK